MVETRYTAWLWLSAAAVAGALAVAAVDSWLSARRKPPPHYGQTF